jgi:hypothetical protein
VNKKWPVRVLLLSVGCGAFAGGLVVAALFAMTGPSHSILVGFVISGLGLILAVIGAIGFAIYGSARKLP